MATIKSYSDLQQSKKLAEILPLESADMEYLSIKENELLVANVPFVKDDSEVEDSAFSHIYDRAACWSLAALLNVLPEGIDNNTDDFSQLEIYKNHVCYAYADGNVRIGIRKDNLVDACYEMILKLHGLNLL